MIYVVTPTYRRFQDWTARYALGRTALHCTRMNVRGLLFQAGDRVVVLVNADLNPDYDDIMNTLYVSESVSDHKPTWSIDTLYDTPLPGEDLETWLAR